MYFHFQTHINKEGQNASGTCAILAQYFSLMNLTVNYMTQNIPLAASLQGEDGSAQVTVWFSRSSCFFISKLFIRSCSSLTAILSSRSRLLSLSDLDSSKYYYQLAMLYMIREPALNSCYCAGNLHLASHNPWIDNRGSAATDTLLALLHRWTLKLGFPNFV